MTDKDAPTRRATPTIVFGVVFIVMSAIDVFMMSRFGFDGVHRAVGHVVGALLVGYVCYGAVYAIFLRRKKPFSYSTGLIIANIFLASTLLMNVFFRS